MGFAELLTERDLILGFAPPDKWEAIRLLVQHLVDTGRLPPQRAEGILEVVLGRERSLSTGLENGIAIPHGAVDGIDRVLACVGVVTRPEGLAFESIDGKPARVVVLLVIPRQQKLLHIRTLKDVAVALGKAEVRERLLTARSPSEAYAELVGGEKKA